ncbi:ferredoxin reductase family protein [Streptomyces mesophilus]|uniref:ferredoxin reductase family protein n=1 Tax=Streptomyces mesophilus TaxID=1775132 RepID=UPI002E29D369|nr:ferric reductase-like transmembrane domain-containing protein [Streptomyces mesophilus]
MSTDAAVGDVPVADVAAAAGLSKYPALAAYLEQTEAVEQRHAVAGPAVPPRPASPPRVPRTRAMGTVAAHGLRVLLGHTEDERGSAGARPTRSAQPQPHPRSDRLSEPAPRIRTQPQPQAQLRPQPQVRPQPQPHPRTPSPATPASPLRIPPAHLRAGLLAGAVAVTGLWAVQVHPSARLDALFATGAHLTGLLAGYGVLVMLFLMARVPAVEHGVGADRLARWHAWGGRWVLSLCVGHTVLALCGYAVHRGTDLLTAGAELLGYPALAAATLGTGLLIAVGVTSARAVRRRVTHETWRALHLLTYLAAALAFAHQLAGPEIAGSKFAAWTWTLLHTTVAALLVWYRLVVPVRQALRHALRVTEVRREGPDVVSVLIQGAGLDELRAEPGQFFRWRFLQRRLWRTALPFSLSAPVREDTLRITVKAAGNHTRRMRRLRPGTRVLATGPFGALTAHRRTRRKVLLLAGGVGITPMRALFETLPGGPGDLTLLYRANNAAQLVLRDELEAIAADRQAALHYLLGPSDASFDPLAPQALRNLVPDLAEHDVYLCGPPRMAEAATAALIRAGVPEQHIHAENFTF